MSAIRDTIRQMITPLAQKVKLMIAKTVITAIDDTKNMQSLQVEALADEVLENIERWQEYGFSSVPIAGAEALAAFIGGSRNNGIIIAVDDRRSRPVDGKPGDTFIYNQAGVIIKLDNEAKSLDFTIPENWNVVTKNMTVTAENIKLGANAVEAIVKGTALKTWLDTHVHIGSAPGYNTTPPVSPLPSTALSTISKVE